MISTFRNSVRVYAQILSFTFKSQLEYRLNFLVQLFYGPAYVLVLYVILSLAFSQSNSLAGWNQEEGKLLFSVFHLLYTSAIFLFIKSVRHFLWMGLRKGELDFILTKPVNTQFLVTFGKPEIQQILLLASVGVLFVYQLFALQVSVFSVNFFGFMMMFLLGLIICYLSVTMYATIGFYVVRAQQIMELYDKTADFSQYPMPIFPISFQFIAFAIIPIAFFGYVPTLFLLGKGSLLWIAAALALSVVLFIFNQLSWRTGIRHYSSASS